MLFHRRDERYLLVIIQWVRWELLQLSLLLKGLLCERYVFDQVPLLRALMIQVFIVLENVEHAVEVVAALLLNHGFQSVKLMLLGAILNDTLLARSIIVKIKHLLEVHANLPLQLGSLLGLLDLKLLLFVHFLHCLLEVPANHLNS